MQVRIGHQVNIQIHHVEKKITMWKMWKKFTKWWKKFSMLKYNLLETMYSYIEVPLFSRAELIGWGKKVTLSPRNGSESFSISTRHFSIHPQPFRLSPSLSLLSLRPLFGAQPALVSLGGHTIGDDTSGS